MRATFGEVVEKLRRSTVQVRAQRHGSGSGVIWSPDGRIITNAHVLSGAATDRVEVELWDGRVLPGKIVNTARRRDLAALQVESSGLPSAAAGDSDALRVGELVIAVGNPLGFTGAASTGVVHGLNWREPRRGSSGRTWLVSQLRLAPGNSGGPLANARGEVVGINTMIAGGLAFAIPSNAVAEFLRAPRDNEPGLGVTVQPVPLDGAGRQLGFVILEVIPGSPAHRASLLQGDILIAAGRRRFRAAQDLESALDAARDGILQLQFRRAGSANICTVAVSLAAAAVRAA